MPALKGNGLTIGVYSAAAEQQVEDYLQELDPDERTITRGHVYTVPRGSSGRVSFKYQVVGSGRELIILAGESWGGWSLPQKVAGGEVPSAGPCGNCGR